MTYAEALGKGRTLLNEARIPDAETDARLLLTHVTGKERSFFLAHGEEVLTEREEQLFFLLLEKRAAHVPLQLIRGKTDFMGLEFLVSGDVLIPRIDTEFLVEEALIEVEDGSRVLDLCTGSGCILLSLMHYKNHISGLGTDFSPSALSLARRNAEELQISGADFLLSDMFQEVEGKFDYILCNPPYIPSGDIPSLMEEVRDYEPLSALDGGEDGLGFYRLLAREAADYLVPEGRLFLEIGYDQGEQVKSLLTEAGFRRIEVIRDYSGNERVVKCSRS